MTDATDIKRARVPQPFDPSTLSRMWIRVTADDADRVASVCAEHKVEFPATLEGVGEDEDSIYLAVRIVIPTANEFRQETVVFALSETVVVTLEPVGGFQPFDKALARFKRHPYLSGTPYKVMRTLLQVMNDATAQSIDLVSASLEAMNDDIGLITNGVDQQGRKIAVADINQTLFDLNEKEELISRCQESQLLLSRAARYLRMEINGDDPDLRSMVDTLLSDIDGVQQHASFEHQKVRYLQQSVMTSLNIQQNQIVKVFTIITAVFLPPTLIATIYGMNFRNMPEFGWEHGFPATIVQTLLAALLPLIYIKRKGWLR